MAIKTYTSNDIQSLAIQLAKETNKIKSIFQKHFIVIGHNTTSDFLTQTIAEENDIAANIEYKRALEFVEMVYSILEAGLRKKDLFKAQQVVWLIDEVLVDTSFIDASDHKKIKDYIGDDAQKRFTLAEKIAELFYSYQEETPEIIEAWKSGEAYEGTEAADELWQREIWNSIAEKLGEQFPDLTKVYAAISEKLKTAEGQQLIKEKLPSVSFFGNLPYSSALVQFIEELSVYIDVSVFSISFNRNNDHRLVKNFGSLAEKQRKLLEKSNPIPLESEQEYAKNLLGELQKRIKGESNISDKVEIDDSITIANSFTVSREVEALYHYLVRQFEENKALMMREITVIIPNVDMYAPAINAYFTNKAFKINYTLYDTSYKVHASPYAAIEAMFRLEKEEFTSKKVMSLLDFDFIRNKFGIGADLSMLTRAVKLANIRHGIEGDKEIETEYVSWRYGLKRLIYGFCLPPKMDEVNFDDASFYPVDEFEERDTQEIMCLNAFVEQLYDWINLRDQERTLSEWVDFIAEKTVEQFIDFKEHDANLLTRILSELEATAKFYSQKVSYRVMRYYLLNHLSQLGGGEQKGFGGVSFVSPNTYLSKPAKIYAFLGMNSQDFPRNTTQLSFDLSHEKRITRNEEDKNLLLNTLLFAKEKVYYSYIGQDINSNTEIPPSTVLDELSAALDELVEEFDTNNFMVKHPLHAFSGRYNSQKEPALRLYSKNRKVSPLDISNSDAEKKPYELPKEGDEKVINLNDLVRFIEDPVKHYFNKVLNVYYSDREIELDEVEPFELDNLESWAVKDELVSGFFNNKDLNSTKDVLKKKGKLPLSGFGDQYFEDLKEDISEVLENKELVILVEKNEEREEKGQVEVGDYLIKGKVEGVFGETLVFTTPSKNKAKYQIRAMLQFLFASMLSEKVKNLLYITKDGCPNVKPKKEDEVRKVLNDWCAYYEKGMQNMVCYSTEMSIKETEILKCTKEMDSNYPYKLNNLIINKTILNPYEKISFPSDYLKEIAKGDAFLSETKADSFIEMHDKLNSLIKDFK